MDLLDGYRSNEGSDDDGSDTTPPSATTTLSARVQKPDRRYLQAAPSISIMTKRKHGNDQLMVVSSSVGGPTTTNANTLVLAPVQGLAVDDPHSQKFRPGGVVTERNFDLDPDTFKRERTKFQRTGQALGPDLDKTVVRTTLGYNSDRLRHFERAELERSKRPKLEKRGGDNEEALVYGSDDEAVHGVWAPPSEEERWHAQNNLTEVQRGGVESLAPEQLAEREYMKEKARLMGVKEEEQEEQSGFERLMERKMAHLLPPKLRGEDSDSPVEAKTTFHGTAETDYKGQSWMAPPAGLASVAYGSDPLEMDHHKCYVPKKCVHRFTGHNKGVQRIRLFPKTGHLLLSAGLDGKCKIWSTVSSPEQSRQRQVLRTYEGHRAAVRDVQFNHDGTKFVSASFDRFLRLWDTESGKVLQTFGNKKVPYCVEFYPHDDNYFVVGYSDNKIVTYDATSGEITQEYNHHLGPVNAVLFCEDHGTTKMVSSSDDKKILVWEWDVGVPIKYISDPTMQSIPALVMHPSHHYFVGQSLDNTICVFQAGNRFALQKKKKFSGHQVAGYACEPGFSPDGQYLMSGDGKGKLFFWDWKRHKILQSYKAHDSGPTIDCVWHPLEPSVVFTCGWDGIIKMWQ